MAKFLFSLKKFFVGLVNAATIDSYKHKKKDNE